MIDREERAAAYPGDEFVHKIAQGLLDHPFRCWFFGDSIGFEGLLAASDLTRSGEYRNFVHGFLRAWGARRSPFQLDDHTAAGAAMCEVLRLRPDPVLREAVLELAEQLTRRPTRYGVPLTTPEATRLLREPYCEKPMTAEQRALVANPGGGIYLDCMHFDPPFYAALYQLGEGREWGERALDELLAYRDLLLDPATGLFRHFWLEASDEAYTRGWGRGQGWALLGMLDVLSHTDGSFERRAEVELVARDLIERMVELQRPDGHWHALAHEPLSGLETSTAAFMATAFYRAIRLGVVDAAIASASADRAYSAMLAAVEPSGKMAGVSAAVYSAVLEEHYWVVPVDFDVPWGQGPVLTAIAERLRQTSLGRG